MWMVHKVLAPFILCMMDDDQSLTHLKFTFISLTKVAINPCTSHLYPFSYSFRSCI